MAEPPPGKPARPDALRVNVLLPDGYDGKRRYPVLYLLEGGGAYDYWLDFSYGELRKAVDGLQAIVVMPEASVVALYADEWNDGSAREPCWEHYHLDELIPEIHRRYRIRAGRRWHAVGGFSSGGLGAINYAAKKPGYFGQTLSFSGVLDIQNPFVQSNVGGDMVLALFSTSKLAETGLTPWTDAFGGPQAQSFFWAAHNPPVLAPALAHTRVYVAHGSPSAPTCIDPQQPQYHCAAQELAGGLTETNINRDWAETFMASARAAGADVTYRPQTGGHWYGYASRYLADAITNWGLFKPVPARPDGWTYKTASRSGEMWDLRFRFTDSPEVLETFVREGDRLRGEGAGDVRLRTVDGCELDVKLPFDVDLRTTSCVHP
jgi:S-formylglutathione hydrolase FrmB